MGYYTQYSLSYHTDEQTTQQIEAYQEGNESMKYCLTDGQRGKWYEWERDMMAMSRAFPSVAFVLEGVGEEYPDIWRATFYGGCVKKEKAVITFKEEVK